MGADNYTKEEKEFYVSIMKEIKKHQDFGKRNPVDIGIECGYSEDDVMGMIYMCQDIVKEEKKAADKKEIPVREDWELEGIIPFEDFVKIDFPEIWESDEHEIEHLFFKACKINKTPQICMYLSIQYASEMKKKSLEKIMNNNIGTGRIKPGFEYLMQWMVLYGSVFNMMLGKSNTCIPATTNQIEAIKNLIKKEQETGKFHPIDMMIIKLNGWDKETIAATDKNERDEARKAIAE